MNLGKLLRLNAQGKKRAKDIQYGGSSSRPYELTLRGITVPCNSDKSKMLLLYLHDPFSEHTINTNQTYNDADNHPQQYIHISDGGDTLHIQTIMRTYMTEERQKSFSVQGTPRKDDKPLLIPDAPSGLQRQKDDVVAEGDLRVIRRHHLVCIQPASPDDHIKVDDFSVVDVSGVVAVRNFTRKDPHTPFYLLVASRCTVIRSATYTEMVECMSRIPCERVSIPAVNFQEVRTIIGQQRVKEGGAVVEFDKTQSSNYEDVREVFGDSQRFCVITQNRRAMGDVQRFVHCLKGDTRDLFLSSLPVAQYDTCHPTAIKAALDTCGHYIIANAPEGFCFTKKADQNKEEKITLTYKQVLTCVFANRPSFCVVLDFMFMQPHAVAFMQISQLAMYKAFGETHLPRMRNTVFASFPLRGALEQQNGDTEKSKQMVLRAIGSVLVPNLAQYVVTYGIPVTVDASLVILRHLLRACDYTQKMAPGHLDMRSFFHDKGNQLFGCNPQNRIRDPLVLNLLESKINTPLEQLQEEYHFYVLLSNQAIANRDVLKIAAMRQAGIDLPALFSNWVMNPDWFERAERPNIETQKIDADDVMRSKRIMLANPNDGTKLVYAVKRVYSETHSPLYNDDALRRLNERLDYEENELELRNAQEEEDEEAAVDSNENGGDPDHKRKREEATAINGGDGDEMGDNDFCDALESAAKMARV